ncbi:MAG: hypothetical protein K0B15_11195 [Lentimicrobium sp.]|nr:hypothetical protein [Lentimicrobium sp.]
MKINIFRINLVCILITLQSVNAWSQSRKPVDFDRPVFLTSETSAQLIYLKWFSKGTKPAPDFMALRYEGKNPVEAGGVKMIYQTADSTFYAFYDTTVLKTSREKELQYFMVQLDTNRLAGYSSPISVIPSVPSRFWFTSTKAEKDDKLLSINLEWALSNKQTVQRIEVERSEHPDKGFLLLATLPADKTRFSDLEIKPDKVYYYRLLAIPTDQSQTVASNVIFSAAYNPQPPAPPWLVKSKRLRGGVSLQYKLSDAEAAGIRIYRNDGITPELRVVSDLIKPNDSLLITWVDTTGLLSGGITYIFAAKTESSSFVESAFSDLTYLRPIINYPPEAPTNFTAYEEDRKVLMHWENHESQNNIIAGYLLQRQSEGAEFKSIHPENSVLRLNSFTDNAVEPGKLYIYRLFTLDIDNNLSAEAAIATIHTETSLPIPPFALQAVSIEAGIQLEWGQVSYDGLSSINIYRYERGKAPVKLTSIPGESTEYTDADTQAGMLYFYYLTTTHENGMESGASEETSSIR